MRTQRLLRRILFTADVFPGSLELPALPAIFEHEIAGLLAVAAQNVSVTIAIESAQLVAVHHGYPSTTEGDRLRLDVGDLYAAEPKAVVLR